MAHVNLKQLIGKLNDNCKRALEGAAGLCLSRTNYNVEIEHWLLKLLETPNSDLHAIFSQFGVDPSRLTMQLNAEIEKFKTGNSRPPALSPSIVDLAREAWIICSVEHSERAARSGHMLAALLSDDALSRTAAAQLGELKKINVDALTADFFKITADSSESGQPLASEDGAAAVPGRTGDPSTPSLNQYTIDLTVRAKQGGIDPVLGRDTEIRQIIDILTRRRQNNPILTGEAGVGKTAVAEGFALRISSGDVPGVLRNVALRSLDMGLLQAGAGVKGEFENRLKSVIEEVKSSPTPIILFIDEAHTMIGAGGAAGQSDAANLLKPALARGELRTIAATTWAEYKKYFEKDAALARRFQVVKVEEPNEPAAIEMMRGLTATLEKHHKIRIMNQAVVDAVKLSNRYISGRQLPDKSVSLLDTTCARIRLSQSSTPPALEDCRRRIDQLNVTIRILERESVTGADHQEQLETLKADLASAEKELVDLETRWKRETELVQQIHDLRTQLEGDRFSDDEPPEEAAPEKPESGAAAENAPAAGGEQSPAPPASTEPAKSPAELQQEFAKCEAELAAVQAMEPLVHAVVNSSAVAETVASWTGIPVGRMVADEINTVLNLKDLMEESIIGQSHALDKIAQNIRTSRANLNDPRTPIGVFLLAGTSGVGKTEAAITLAELLYGGEQNMTTINMSEFKEEHKVSLLMGSPPGYVGYGEGGVLTEAVRRKPYSVVLLDEMEKAHPGVQDIFYQVFDKGTMKDGEGRDIDFKNTVILMTTNAGTDLIKSLCADPDTAPAPDAFLQAVFPELLKTFKPAFLGRLQVIPFYPLTDDVMVKIIHLKLGKVGRRITDHYKAKFSYTPEVVKTILGRCTEVDTGARNVDHILSRTVLPELSSVFLAQVAEGQEITATKIGVTADGSFEYVIE